MEELDKKKYTTRAMENPDYGQIKRETAREQFDQELVS
jgi:hypothetical protein